MSPIAILWHCRELISVTILGLNVKRYERCIGPVACTILWYKAIELFSLMNVK